MVSNRLGDFYFADLCEGSVRLRSTPGWVNTLRSSWNRFQSRRHIAGKGIIVILRKDGGHSPKIFIIGKWKRRNDFYFFERSNRKTNIKDTLIPALVEHFPMFSAENPPPDPISFGYIFGKSWKNWISRLLYEKIFSKFHSRLQAINVLSSDSKNIYTNKGVP